MLKSMVFFLSFLYRRREFGRRGKAMIFFSEFFLSGHARLFLAGLGPRPLRFRQFWPQRLFPRRLALPVCLIVCLIFAFAAALPLSSPGASSGQAELAQAESHAAPEKKAKGPKEKSLGANNPPEGKKSEEEKPEGGQKKKWSVSVGESVSQGALREDKMVSSTAFGFSYSFTKNLSLSVEGAYLIPLGYVADPSLYGLADAIVSGGLSLEALKGFMGFEWASSAGVGLPFSAKTYRSGQYASFFGGLSHNKELISKKLLLNFSHSIYSGFFRYRENRSGSPHPPVTFSHSAGLSYQLLERLKISGGLSLLLYIYQYDSSSDPKIYDAKWRFNGAEGSRFKVSYELWPKYKVKISAGAAWNAPIISPLLTGYPPFNLRYWSYSLGINGAI